MNRSTTKRRFAADAVFVCASDVVSQDVMVTVHDGPPPASRMLPTPKSPKWLTSPNGLNHAADEDSAGSPAGIVVIEGGIVYNRGYWICRRTGVSRDGVSQGTVDERAGRSGWRMVWPTIPN